MLGWSYTTLSIRPSNDKNFSLSVQATDSSGNSSPVATEVITVDPLAPTVAPASVSGTMGQPIALNLGIVPNGLAGDSNSLSSAKISGIPSGTTLGNANGDTLIVSAGSVTFSAGQLAAGALNGLAITPASSGSFSLTVGIRQLLAAVFGLGQRPGARYFAQRHGSKVSIWRIGWSAMRSRTSAR
jgi:hypothetical protein